MVMKQNRDCEQPEDLIQVRPTGSLLAFQQFLPVALEFGGPLVPCRINLGSAYHNVVEGVRNVLKERGRLESELPGLNLDHVQSLPELVLAVMYAADQAEQTVPKQTRAMISSGGELRGKLLIAARALAASNLVPSHEVAHIQKGSGYIDLADDLIALATLFNKHARKIAGKTAITSADIQEAMELGTELRKTLRPKATRKNSPDADTARAIEHRDRLFALLVYRYDLVRRAGAWLFGLDEVGKLVPALGSRTRTRPRTTTVVEAKSDSQ